MNCGSYFVALPGLIQKEGHNYIQWKCSGCGRTEEWPAPYSMQPQTQNTSDIME